MNPSPTVPSPTIPSPSSPSLRPVLAAVLALVTAVLLALPAAAYVIYLKDGSTIIAQEEYEVRDGKAYFVLQSGTATFIDADQIDVPRTRQANKNNLGAAQVIEGGETRDVTDRTEEPEETTLGDLIQQRERERQARGPAPDASPGIDRPPVERDPSAPVRPRVERSTPTTAVPPVQQTPAGYPDLANFDRLPFSDLEVGAELKQFFANQGLEEARIFQGTVLDRPLVEVTASSEASVFRALAVAASALIHLRERGRPAENLELYLVTSNENRAGQFILDPESSRALLAGDVDVATFYLENVQF